MAGYIIEWPGSLRLPLNFEHFSKKNRNKLNNSKARLHLRRAKGKILFTSDLYPRLLTLTKKKK